MKNIEAIRAVTIDYQNHLRQCITTQDSLARQYIKQLVGLGLTEEEAIELFLEITAKTGQEQFGPSDDATKDILARFMDLM